jgi:hypothetical protein
MSAVCLDFSSFLRLANLRENKIIKPKINRAKIPLAMGIISELEGVINTEEIAPTASILTSLDLPM